MSAARTPRCLARSFLTLCQPTIAAALLSLAAPLSTQELAQLQDPEPSFAEQFGWRLAIDGNTIVVGAHNHDSRHSIYGVGLDDGCALVFTGGGSSWSLQSKLLASDRFVGDHLGWDVDIEGDRVVVGSPYRRAQGINSGAVYVFERSGTTWTETAKVFPTTLLSGSHFGCAVALDSDRMVVGARFEDVGGTTQSGAAYIFRHTPGGWVEESVLRAPQPTADAQFGFSVDIDGLTVAVGAPRAQGRAGAVYVSEHRNGVWTAATPLPASGTDSSAQVGASVALFDDHLLVGAPKDSTLRGAVLLFQRNQSTWVQASKLTPSNPHPHDQFGFNISARGDLAIIGAPGGPLASSEGRAYLFRRNPSSSWSEATVLHASDASGHDRFGTAVAISEHSDVAVSGAYLADPGASNAGKAYVLPLRLGCSPLHGTAGVPNINDYTVGGQGSGSCSCTDLTYRADQATEFRMSTAPGASVTFLFAAGRSCRPCSFPWSASPCALPGLGCASGNQAIDLYNSTAGSLLSVPVQANPGGVASVQMALPPGIRAATQAVVFGVPCAASTLAFSQAYNLSEF